MTAALSPERVGRVTASRLPAVLGISPYNDRTGVMREMVRQHFGAPQEFTGNIATEWGNAHEADGITEYERLRSVLVLGCTEFFIHPEHSRLGATPDGLGLVEQDGLVEVKAPFRGTYADISERPDYETQIRLQIECTGRFWGDLVVWRPSGIAVSRVDRDPDWYATVHEPITEFLAEYDAIIADLDKAEPYLQPLVDERADPEWQLAALEWKEARAAKRRAEELMDAARDELVRLSGGNKSRGWGVQVFPSDRKGSVDPKRASKDGIDLDKYRSAGKTVYTVREATDNDR
jgi:hypothetical protein